MCGENNLKGRICAIYIGSPPRVRGKPAHASNTQYRNRITPACAGKTWRRYMYGSRAEDHPRVCGENSASTVTRPNCLGSPPRVRGKLPFSCSSFAHFGITPACAGKTASLAPGVDAEEDHPRVCGENPAGRTCSAGRRGSPPRVRGKHFGNGVFPWLILVLSLDLL